MREHSDADRAAVKNLYAFYRYDLAPFIPGGPGSVPNAFGVFDGDEARSHDAAVAELDLWWERPGALFAHLFRVGATPAGFALVSARPHASPGVDHRLCDFFVVNRFRRRGVGTRAAVAVFDRHPGRWELGVEPENRAADAFWRRVLGAYDRSYAEAALPLGEGAAAELPAFRFRTA